MGVTSIWWVLLVKRDCRLNPDIVTAVPSGAGLVRGDGAGLTPDRWSDPPHEPQGRYGVFAPDASTLGRIRAYAVAMAA